MLERRCSCPILSHPVPVLPCAVLFQLHLGVLKPSQPEVGQQTAEQGRAIRQWKDLWFLNVHLRHIKYLHILGTQL